MSKQIDPFNDSLTNQLIKGIDQFNLPLIQKLHLRILAHCLFILKATSAEDNNSYHEEILIREWCDKQSQQFNDQKFNDILYDQLISVAKKLKNLSQKLGKNINDLEIDDLVLLVKENSKINNN